jgi:hypothetical protein
MRTVVRIMHDDSCQNHALPATEDRVQEDINSLYFGKAKQEVNSSHPLMSNWGEQGGEGVSGGGGGG